MYRRVVSLLLLPSLLLMQRAGLGHAHGGHEPAGHDRVPHFHIKPAGHEHGRHRHPHGSHSHHRHEPRDQRDTHSPPPSEPQPLSDHDSDAVYASADLLVSEREQLRHDSAWVTWIAACPPSHFESWNGTQDHFVRWLPRPPRPLSDSCPVYLQHLALLI
jgi:hypothetical protein